MLKMINRGFRKIKLFINSLFKDFFYFYLPNFKSLVKSRVIFQFRKPQFNQLTVFTGLGKIEIGDSCSLGYKFGGFHRGGSIEFQARYKNSKIVIGQNIATNNNVFICAANYIEIGDDTLIGQNVTLMDFEAHGLDPEKRRVIGQIGEIIIGKNCWLGNNTIILKNTIIGDNSIVAAGAVVSGKFPSNVIIGGVPGKVIKHL